MKKCVDVITLFSKDGEVIPRTILWDDQRRYEITSVKGVNATWNPEEAQRGLDFLCEIKGKEAHLYYERNHWYVDAI